MGIYIFSTSDDQEYPTKRRVRSTLPLKASGEFVFLFLKTFLELLSAPNLELDPHSAWAVVKVVYKETDTVQATSHTALVDLANVETQVVRQKAALFSHKLVR